MEYFKLYTRRKKNAMNSHELSFNTIQPNVVLSVYHLLTSGQV